MLPVPPSLSYNDFAKTVLEMIAAQFGLTFEQQGGRVVGRVDHFHTGGIVRHSRLRDEIPAILPRGYDIYRVDPAALEDAKLRPLREMQERFVRKAMEEYRRKHERLAAIFFIGYDPQLLLEDHRHD